MLTNSIASGIGGPASSPTKSGASASSASGSTAASGSPPPLPPAASFFAAPPLPPRASGSPSVAASSSPSKPLGGGLAPHEANNRTRLNAQNERGERSLRRMGRRPLGARGVGERMGAYISRGGKG